MKYFLLNHLGIKHGLLIEFGQFISYYKIKKYIEKLCKSNNLKTSFNPFCVSKEISATFIGKLDFLNKLLKLDM